MGLNPWPLRYQQNALYENHVVYLFQFIKGIQENLVYFTALPVLFFYDIWMFYLQDLAFRNESGLTGNPLKITWLEGQPEPASRTNTPADVFCSSQVQFTWALLCWIIHHVYMQMTVQTGTIIFRVVKRGTKHVCLKRGLVQNTEFNLKMTRFCAWVSPSLWSRSESITLRQRSIPSSGFGTQCK